MKQILWVLLFAIFYAANAQAQLNQNLHVSPTEVYIGFSPAAQYLEIIEYDLRSTRANDRMLDGDIKHIKDLVKKGDYCEIGSVIIERKQQLSSSRIYNP